MKRLHSDKKKIPTLTVISPEVRDRLIEWDISFAQCVEFGFVLIDTAREKSFTGKPDVLVFLQDLIDYKRKFSQLKQFLVLNNPQLLSEFESQQEEHDRKVSEEIAEDSVVSEKDYQT